MLYELKSKSVTLIDISHMKSLRKYNRNDEERTPVIEIDGKDYWYDTGHHTQRDEDYENIKNMQNSQKKGGFKMLKNLKEYFNKHQDALITISLIALIDHFLFNGALTQKLQTTIEKILGGAEKQLTRE